MSAADRACYQHRHVRLSVTQTSDWLVHKSPVTEPGMSSKKLNPQACKASVHPHEQQRQTKNLSAHLRIYIRYKQTTSTRRTTLYIS